MSKKKIIIIVAVLLAVGVVGNLLSGGGSVSSAKDGEKVARKVAQEFFSGEDYEISGGSKTGMPKIYFEAEVGEDCQDHLKEAVAKGESVEGGIDVYAYSVKGALLYVSEDGRVIGKGGPLGNDLYRLR